MERNLRSDASLVRRTNREDGRSAPEMSCHVTSVAVINGEGTELQTVTVFTTADEYIEFNFGADGKFIHIFVGTTNDEENEAMKTCKAGYCSVATPVT